MPDGTENPLQISEIKPIQKSIGLPIATRDEIVKLVEVPLVKACEILYDLNIQTMSTSANKGNVGDGGHISINPDSLSDENRKIAEEIGSVGSYDLLYIKIPIKAGSTIEEIEQKSLELVDKFQKQPFFWCPRFSMLDMKKMYAIPDDEEGWSPEDFTNENSYYYDVGSETFFLSKEHFDKYTEGTKREE